MKTRVSTFSLAVAIAAAASSLAACGGGGGGGVTPPTGGGSTPTPIITSTPGATTNAAGTVVDDSNGNPLAGVRVVVMPWGPCGATPAPASITPENDGCPTPLPSPQATTDATGHFTLNGVPNGHYILVIGNDAVATPPPGFVFSQSCSAQPCPTPNPVPGAAIQATVHDNITLTGGNQTLTAPTMPPLPTVTLKAWETNGSYRLASLDAGSEAPCVVAWQQLRAAHSVPLASVDEWLLENSREINAARLSGGVPVNPVTILGDHTLVSTESSDDGGTDCNSFLQSAAFGATTPFDERALWIGMQYAPVSPAGAGVGWQGFGMAQFVEDPRSFTDPFVPNWL